MNGVTPALPINGTRGKHFKCDSFSFAVCNKLSVIVEVKYKLPIVQFPL